MAFTNFNLGKRVSRYNISRTFDAYTRVDVVMGEDAEGNIITVSYPPNVPDDDGRVLTIDMPMCTDSALALTAAQRIYDSLQHKNDLAYQYQPMQADGALADPSMEFGDSVDINDVHSGFYTRSTKFGRLMKASLSSPTDEEVDHEYPYEDSQQRQITRTNKEYRAGLYINSQAITAEVSARQQADNNVTTTLRSEISQTATSISATVTAETNARIAADGKKLDYSGGTQSFSWLLNSTAFLLKNNNTPVFQFDANGLAFKSNGTNVFTVTRTGGLYVKGNGEFTGKITATSGQIGGFTIGSSSLYNGMTSLTDTSHNGVYVGTNGIACGKGAFKVTSSGAITASNLNITGGSITLGSNFSVTNTGNVTANNMALTGTLIIGGTAITAAALQSGAQSAYNNSYTWSTGAGYGYSYNYATSRTSGQYPVFFRASVLYCSSLTATSIIDKNGLSHDIRWRYLKDGSGNYYYFLCGS